MQLHAPPIIQVLLVYRSISTIVLRKSTCRRIGLVFVGIPILHQ